MQAGEDGFDLTVLEPQVAALAAGWRATPGRQFRIGYIASIGGRPVVIGLPPVGARESQSEEMIREHLEEDVAELFEPDDEIVAVVELVPATSSSEDRTEAPEELVVRANEPQPAQVSGRGSPRTSLPTARRGSSAALRIGVAPSRHVQRTE